ncbi:LacI family DNA-binding transcriptional regulator [Rhizobium sp. BK060]|uniref:LacI family DNA-binding transcriptional regulator n=1 Tax=Rhizobium sp. BK060 TaxID=2587096 RepID=UPI001612721F|nr:LacI family DNA-binding transcriptional regulator [Rhizobium sp. BK060]MBB3395999.1 DNA-binding LacI/PurR family transcriptional regulator [Rhizobium sp. BK060]
MKADKQAGSASTSAQVAAAGSPTQHDVAKFANVSQSAVSRVLSGGSVSEPLRKKVIDACEKLGYVVDLGARALVRGSSNMVAVVVANIMNPFYPYILDKLTLRIQSGGFEVLLLNASGGRDIDELVPIVLQYKVRSAIIMTSSLSSRMAKKLEEHKIPTVMLNRYSTISSGNSVACDNLAGGRLVADEFLKRGFKSVAYVGGAAGSSTNLDRRNGFLQRLAEDGAQPVVALDGEFNHEWGYNAGRMLRHYQGVEAVFCADDVIAMGVIDSLKEHGLSVPQDVSVVGFDDIPSAGWAAYSITTIKQPVDDMIEQTLKILESEDRAGNFEVRIPGTLIVRSSFKPL